MNTTTTAATATATAAAAATTTTTTTTATTATTRLSRDAWQGALNSVKIPTEWMNALVMNYLTTQGHAAAAATFERETGTPQILDPASTAVRMRIRNAIERDGNPSEAIDQVVDVNPEIVEERPELLFRLKKQEFIELIKQGRTEDALRFAEEELARRVEGDEGLLRELESAMALLLFEDPRKGPLGHYLSDEYMSETANVLNRAILASETRAGDGRSRLPHLLHVLLWLEDRADEVVRREVSGERGLKYVPRVVLDPPGGDWQALDYASTVFGAGVEERMGGEERVGGEEGVEADVDVDVDMDISDED